MGKWMSANPRPRQSCPNQACDYHGVIGKGNIVRHSYLKVKCGRRRRHRCKACGKTFSRNTNTPYHRLHASRNLFDRVAHLSVEGVSISAIARICGRSWSTIARWLKKAARAARGFNDRRLRRFEMAEVQADEIRTLLGSLLESQSASVRRRLRLCVVCYGSI